MSPRPECLLVETEEQLATLCQRLQHSTYLALDTEFIREETYYPELCLLQIANDDIAACIDPLRISNLQPLLDLIYRPDILKLFHAGGQDLEILFHLCGRMPTPLFDTQIAAPLLGFPLQCGYAALVKSLLNIDLDKSQTRTDWRRRPLSREQIEYAWDDVIHLLSIYSRLRDDLQQQGRLDWLDDDFAELANPQRLQPPLEQLWQKIHGSQRLNPSQLAVLSTLTAWREQQARQLDVPRSRVLRDEVLLDLARLRPRDVAQLAQLRSLRDNTVRQYGATLIEQIAAASGAPPPPRPRRSATLTLQQEALTDCLLAVTRLCAEQHRINPALLSGRKELEQLVLGERDLDVLRGWRRRLTGDVLLAYLEGTVQLVNDGPSALRLSTV